MISDLIDLISIYSVGLLLINDFLNVTRNKNQLNCDFWMVIIKGAFIICTR